MNVLVVGCGKVGSKLASVLDKMGNDVCIIDRDSESFERLDHEYSGYTVAGVPIDQDVLRRAGIENSDAVITVTQDDNVNIMVSQVAREIFHVGTVLTRIYDPMRENVYSHFNLTTVCPTNMTVDTVCNILEDEANLKTMSFGSSTVAYSMAPPQAKQVGQTLGQLAAESGKLLFGVQSIDSRLTLACHSDYLIQENDRLVYARIIQ